MRRAPHRKAGACWRWRGPIGPDPLKHRFVTPIAFRPRVAELHTRRLLPSDTTRHVLAGRVVEGSSST